MYHYFSADKIHDGFKYLSSDTVIVTDDKGKIVTISDKHEIPEEQIAYYTGTLCPGFINVHCHIELSHLKGLIPRHTGLTDFIKQISSLRKNKTEDERKEAAKSAIESMKQNGIVAVGDIANSADTVLLREDADLHIHTFVESIGFNSLSAPNSFNYSSLLLNDFQQKNESAFSKILNQSIVPHAPYSVSKELFELINQQQEDSVISMHNQESVAEDEYFKSKTGRLKELYDFLKIDDSDFTAFGKSSLQTVLPYFEDRHSLILVHNTFTEKDDIDFLKKRSNTVNFCLCPNANLYIENRLPDLHLLIESGVNICIGTDSLASNDDLNIYAEICQLQTAFPQIDMEQLLCMATINGAIALQMDEFIGSFTEGKTPGINLLKNDNSIEKIL